MKKWILFVLLIFTTISLLSQEKKVYQEGTPAQQNINEADYKGHTVPTENMTNDEEMVISVLEKF